MQTWLVTGGTGSFGTAFIQTVLRERPDVRIVSLSRNAEMRYRLEALCPSERLVVMPGDVRCPDEVAEAFAYRPDVVVHASAEKHIGTGERHAEYVQSINVGGAMNVIAHARGHRTKTVVALSTDKACAPVNVYGRSKADAERLFVQHGYTVVRYGNVVGSSGSVVPLFIRQRNGKRLTVTDRRMTRYWMPLADPPIGDYHVVQEPGSQPVLSAVRFVLMAIDLPGGAVYVPSIPSGSVQQLAEAIGGPDCAIDEIGIRDGEKLHEQLVCPDDGPCWRTSFGYVLTPNGRVGWERMPQGFEYRSDQAVQPVRVDLGVAA